MASLTVLGTAVPWGFRGNGIDDPGTPGAVAAFGRGYNDGSTAGGAGVGINTTQKYGRTHLSDTNPTTWAVVAGHIISLQWTSGTVATGAAGAGNSLPVGTTGLPANGPNEVGSSGYSFPSNQIKNCLTALGGLVGSFTDATGQNISVWDWRTRSIVSNNAVAGSQCASASGGNTVYTVSLAGGSSNGLVGQFIYVTGFVTNPVANNGTYACVASTASTVTLANPSGVAEVHAFTATSWLNSIVLQVPTGATLLSMGCNDDVLNDNTGSWAITALDLGDVGGIGGIPTPQTGYPTTYPISQVSKGSLADYTDERAWVFMPGSKFLPQYQDQTLNGLMAGYMGQLFPHGAQNTGGNPAGTGGQNFPY